MRAAQIAPARPARPGHAIGQARVVEGVALLLGSALLALALLTADVAQASPFGVGCMIVGLAGGWKVMAWRESLRDGRRV